MNQVHLTSRCYYGQLVNNEIDSAVRILGDFDEVLDGVTRAGAAFRCQGEQESPGNFEDDNQSVLIDRFDEVMQTRSCIDIQTIIDEDDDDHDDDYNENYSFVYLINNKQLFIIDLLYNIYIIKQIY